MGRMVGSCGIGSAGAILGCLGLVLANSTRLEPILNKMEAISDAIEGELFVCCRRDIGVV